MRVAPLAVNYQVRDIKKLDLEGAQLAAITHGYPILSGEHIVDLTDIVFLASVSFDVQSIQEAKNLCK